MPVLKYPKHEEFAQQYIKNQNQTQAAISAGYAERSASAQAVRLLRNESIAKRIAELQTVTAKKLDISHDDITRRLKTWLESDLTEVAGKSIGELKELPLEIRQLITKIKPTKYGYEVEFMSKKAAADMIARHIGYYEADNNQKRSQINIENLDVKVLAALAASSDELDQ